MIKYTSYSVPTYLFRHQGTILGEFISVFDLRSFVVDEVPEDGILMSTHVAFGTWYEVFFICFIVF
jgi:hypothetical protein